MGRSPSPSPSTTLEGEDPGRGVFTRDTGRGDQRTPDPVRSSRSYPVDGPRVGCPSTSRGRRGRRGCPRVRDPPATECARDTLLVETSVRGGHGGGDARSSLLKPKKTHTEEENIQDVGGGGGRGFRAKDTRHTQSVVRAVGPRDAGNQEDRVPEVGRSTGCFGEERSRKVPDPGPDLPPTKAKTVDGTDGWRRGSGPEPE